MNNYIYIILLTFILASANLEGNHIKYSQANGDEINSSVVIQDSEWLPETKVMQDKELELNGTDSHAVKPEMEEANRTFSKESDEYLSYFVGKEFDPSYHPPYAASGYANEYIVIDKIEAGKASGKYTSHIGFIWETSVFFNTPINDDNSIDVVNKWGGIDFKTEESFPEAYTKMKIIFDRVVDGNPVIKTIALGPVEGSEKIIEEYYYLSEPGTIHEWFSNNYMYNYLKMSDEEMVDWITKNINTPWK